MTKLVGIVNVTPDSFSDGGQCASAEQALKYIEQLIVDGADIIDIGAESTRPEAYVLSDAEEWARLETALPQAIALCHEHNVQVSVDTYHPNTAQKAIACGVDIINDVSGGRNEAMLNVLSDAKCDIVLMHSLSIPADKNVVLADNADVVQVIQKWTDEMLEHCDVYGIARERITLDPGIGFGKTPRQSLELLLRCDELLPSDVPLYIGHSRKSFLSLLTDKPAHERDELTLAFSSMLFNKDVDYLRVHDVRSHAKLRGALNG